MINILQLEGRHMFITDTDYIFNQNPTYIVIPVKKKNTNEIEARFNADSILVADYRFVSNYNAIKGYKFSDDYISILFAKKFNKYFFYFFLKL